MFPFIQNATWTIDGTIGEEIAFSASSSMHAECQCKVVNIERSCCIEPDKKKNVSPMSTFLYYDYRSHIGVILEKKNRTAGGKERSSLTEMDRKRESERG